MTLTEVERHRARARATIPALGARARRSRRRSCATWARSAATSASTRAATTTTRTTSGGKAIDFCMKKDGDDLLGGARQPELLGGLVDRHAPVADRARRDARARLSGRASARSPLEDLYRNDGIDYLHEAPGRDPDRDPRPDIARLAATYWKLRRRGAFDFPVLSVAAAARLDGDGSAEARIVLGAVASLPLRASASRAALVGRPLDAGRSPRPPRPPPGPRSRWTTPTSLSSGARK